MGFLYLSKANTLVKPNLYTLTEKFSKQENFSVKPSLLFHLTDTYGVHTCARCWGCVGKTAKVTLPQCFTDINLIMKINSDACCVGGSRGTPGSVPQSDLTQNSDLGRAPRGPKDE